MYEIYLFDLIVSGQIVAADSKHFTACLMPQKNIFIMLYFHLLELMRRVKTNSVTDEVFNFTSAIFCCR